MNTNDHRRALNALLCDQTLDQEAKDAIRWALDQTQEPAPPPDGRPDILPNPPECIEIGEIGGAAEQRAMAWIRANMKSDQSKEPMGLLRSTVESPETHEWIPALAALAKRELRFWKEAGRVSGDVTRRAAGRAIEGLEQILKTIPTHLRS